MTGVVCVCVCVCVCFFFQAEDGIRDSPVTGVQTCALPICVYSNRFSILEPKVFLTSKEVLMAPKIVTEGRRTTAYKYYGVAYLEHNSVFKIGRASCRERV